ncbi:MAG: hypothetical protein LBS15_01475 [Endomicrobium sp.]|jgi:hypothetical protein|nr:hypothetical protein [Endomicrobium sp.]
MLFVVPRELNPLYPSECAIIILSKIEAGNAFNIMCNKVTIDDSTERSLSNDEVRNFIMAGILRKLEALDLTYEVICVAKYPMPYTYAICIMHAHDNEMILRGNFNVVEAALTKAAKYYNTYYVYY